MFLVLDQNLWNTMVTIICSVEEGVGRDKQWGKRRGTFKTVHGSFSFLSPTKCAVLKKVPERLFYPPAVYLGFPSNFVLLTIFIVMFSH